MTYGNQGKADLLRENERLRAENARLRQLADVRGQEIVLLSDRLAVVSALKDRLQTIYDAWITSGRPK